MHFAPVQLHIPDGFLSIPVAIVGWIVAVLMIGMALRQTNRQMGERKIPLMGVLAAFIFAAQAINFPVAAGTSGHLLGGALAAIVMGPWAATLIMTAVIAVQGLLFQDGGLVVMGWNILNMGVFTAFTGYAVYGLVTRIMGQNKGARLGGAFLGAWVSVVVGAIATAFELAISGTSPLYLALPAMAGVHALIGLGEGIITMGAVSFLLASRPEILQQAEVAPGRRGANLVVGGLLLTVLVAAFSPLASPSPDGLEKVAEKLGFLALGESPVYEILPDYTVPFIGNETLTTILAVIVGTILVFCLAWFLGRRWTKSQGAGD
ncbi:MAG: cobalamin biosynthesis protein CbiM [Chloroflexi bacterium RBG_16_48_8]|nr:MAG: cobalamin biosynthesis protein CbiM [Chloroflexi bacterium RBG_16_48_8]